VLEQTQVRNVVLAFGAASEAELVAAIRRCSVLPVQFYTVPRFFELGVTAANVGYEVDGFALVPMRRPGHGHSMWPLKRAFDLVVASVLLVLASPVLLACAVLVKLSSPGPVLFKQVRVGVSGVPFQIFKFRSMRVNDDHHTTWSVDDDERVTRIGDVLRRSHLDELPQLFNVIRGDMSIVGPRPERPYFVEQFSSEIDGYGDRHRVPVGITGWAQVNGYWGDTSIEARVRLDNRYIENWSPWRDLVIALRTIPTLLGGRR
jgi:exopolysaccharide biosynthesis polyprenyl glycosylphosphotransferase